MFDLIDVSMIKTSPFLVGANVLKSLFCVSDDCVLEQRLTEDDNHTLIYWKIMMLDILNGFVTAFYSSGILPKEQALIVYNLRLKNLVGFRHWMGCYRFGKKDGGETYKDHSKSV